MISTFSLNPLDAAAALVVLAALLGYINYRMIGMPHAIGLTIMGAAASLIIVALDRLVPDAKLGHVLRGYLEGIDFRAALLDGMLSFLLFAGALHINLPDLRERKWAVAALSTASVILSTLMVGVGFFAVAALLGVDLSLTWCLVFGALISPTDPVAVLGILKSARVPATLEATVAGESLFNDGVGIVVFSILLAIAMGDTTLSTIGAMEMFAIQAFGGAALGLAVGGLGFIALRSIDEYNLETLITLAIVMGGYALSHRLGVSGPVAMAAAGLVIGNHGMQLAMSDVTRDYIHKFWSLIDEILNSVLFLLIGIEVVTVAMRWDLLALGLLTIPIVLAARAGSVGMPLAVLSLISPIMRGTFPVLLWGGLRGGISIALALSLPFGGEKDVILTATYVVVIFSVIVQGATVGAAARRFVGSPASGAHR
jgi:monovalent cation:H+ antiporter, CPA1 family